MVGMQKASVAHHTPWAWALSGVLVGTLLALVFFAPARWLASVVNQRSLGHVVLDEPQGSVWSGSAWVTLTGGAGSRDAARLPTRLAWQIRPSSTGVQLHLTAACCMQQAWVWQISPHWGGVKVSVSDTPSAWSASLLTGLGTPFNTLALQGQLKLETHDLSLDWSAGRLQLGGQAQLQAQQLSSRLSTLSPMGSYRVKLMGGAVTALQLETLSGPLQLSGSGQWVGGKLQFNGEATSAEEYQAALGNLLNIIGRRTGARSVIKLG